MRKIISSNFKFILLGLLIIEVFSFLGNTFPFLSNFIFIILALTVLFLSFKDLRFGLWIVLAELLIGSFGYLFHLNIAGTIISIRMAIWSIVIAVWLGRFLDESIRKIQAEKKAPKLKIQASPYFNLLLILGLFIAWGGINGVISGNSFDNIFFDINSWFYLALIIPLYETVLTTKKEFLKPLLEISLACVLWISFKTLFLVFVFSHNIFTWMTALYNWVRNTGVGEITIMESDFTRVFFQSHIFIVIAFFITLVFLNHLLFSKTDSLTKEVKKRFIFYLLSLTVFSAVIILSFSRSFWLGLSIGLLLFLALIQKKYSWKVLGINILGIFLIALMSLGLIVGIIKFPGIGEASQIDTTDTIRNRSQSFSGEAAVSSRWNLLPKLWKEIKKDPILGKGFGTAITYESSDPRILQSTVDGKFTTYTFEWGWLDIWLKLGLFGLVCYLLLIGKVILEGLRNKKLFKSPMINGLILGLLIVSIINFFTPYFNHPLGLGFLILAITIIDKEALKV